MVKVESNILNGLFTLAGVAVGFSLSEGASWLKSNRKNRYLKSALNSELIAIKRMIPHRQDILSKAAHAFSDGRVLDPASTHFPRSAYESILDNAPELLSVEEQDCLHVSYERLRVIDEQMDTAVAYFNTVRSAHSSLHAADALALKMSDMEEALITTIPLIDSLIQNDPIDVYNDVRT
ncbi:MAG: hypothetical protein CMN80_12445 [Spongiibacter sp.]|nr:hypothetical protein [Spongiibacter sp.]